jgi:hypothetical protein
MRVNLPLYVKFKLELSETEIGHISGEGYSYGG